MPSFTDKFPDDPTKAFWHLSKEISPIFCLCATIDRAIEEVDSWIEIAKPFHENKNGIIWHYNATFLSKAVDLFQSYINSLIGVIFSQKPEMLPDKKISVREIFGSPDLEELKRRSVDVVVHEYGYMSIVDLGNLLKKNFNFDIFPNRITAHRLNRIIQKRNIITHNNGIINSRFISQSGCKIDAEGSRVRVYSSLYVFYYLIQLAADIDKRALNKFKLERATPDEFLSETTY